MKKIVFAALAAITAAFCAVSCIDDPLIAGEQAFCTVRDGKIYTDEGLTYNVVDWDSQAVWDTLKRVYIYCDVVKKVSDTEFDIHLLYFEPMYLVPGVKLSECVDTLVGTDPIRFYQGWITGKESRYMNVRFTYMYYEKQHTVNMVYDDIASSEDTVKFQLRHNAYGETAESTVGPYLTAGQAFLSMPLDQYMPAGKDSVVVAVGYDWYKTQGDYFMPTTEHGVISAKISAKP